MYNSNISNRWNANRYLFYTRTLLYVRDILLLLILIHTFILFKYPWVYNTCNDIDVTHMRYSSTFKILDIMINVYRLVYIRKFYCGVYSL